MRTYNTADVTLVSQWADKFYEINTLIAKVLGGENLENLPPVPSFEDEIEYQRLKFWFRENHERFVPIWTEFCISNGNSIERTDDFGEMEYQKNPFLYYYSPENLLDLAYTIGATSNATAWDPDKQAVEFILRINNRFRNTVIHFVHWIGEFAETSC